MTIDPVTFARFMVLPGAAELVDCYSRIPPGALRQSVISHAQVIAGTYDEARTAGAPIPDPLTIAAQLTAAGSVPRLAIDGPAKQPPKVKLESKEAQAVELRMGGMAPPQIARKVGLSQHAVEQALAAAKKAGMRWTRLPPGARVQPVAFATSMAELGGAARGMMSKAAVNLGISLERYVELRALLIELRGKGAPIEELIVALKPVPEVIIWRWIKTARQAGFNIPAQLDEADFVPAPPAAWPIPYDQQDAHGQKVTRFMAKNAGLTVEQQQARERDVIARLKRGDYPVQIEEATGLPPHIITTIKHRALVAGVVLPKLMKGGGASKAMGRPVSRFGQPASEGRAVA